MKVIMDNGGIKSHSVNDKAVISHGIAQKTELSKKNGGIENRQIRTVGGSDTGGKPADTQGVPSVAAQKREHFAKNAHKGGTTPEITKAVEPPKSGVTERKTLTLNAEKTAKIGKPKPSPTAAARWKKRFKDKRPKLAPRKNYKVLKNGVVSSEKLTKRRERVIYRQQPQKLKKLKLKRLQKRKFKIDTKQADLMQMAMSGGSIGSGSKTDLAAVCPKGRHDVAQHWQTGGNLKKLVPMGVSGAKKVYRFAQKPAEMLKQEFYSKSDKNEMGTSAAKLGMQTYDYVGRGAKTAVETGVKTVKKGAKITKRVYRKLHKPTSAELKRTLKKRIFRNKLKSQANYLAKQAVRKGANAAGKATANAAKKTAQAAYKAAQATAKAVVNAVSKAASLIAETMPYSLIVIGAVLLVLLIALMFGSMLGGASGAVAGGGAWLVDDNSSQTPEEIYEGYKKFVEQAKDVMETQAKKALKDKVTSFCDSDDNDPRKIIQYIDKDNNILRYPAKGADSTINPIIDNFGTEDYANYMSLLFVLMTREKQQADGVTDAEIYDFDFKKEDFEEFMKTVNENSCRWGDTFVIKTAVETGGNTCPNEQCRRETEPGCKCCSYTDEEGEIHEYCGGHCPNDHTKLTVKLYTVKDYYEKDYPEIYNFTENEKTRYETSKAIIQGMIDYWEGGNN